MSGWIWFLLAWTAIAFALAPIVGRLLRRRREEMEGLDEFHSFDHRQREREKAGDRDA